MHRYSDEQKDFIRKFAPGRYNDELTKLFNDHFGTSLAKSQIRNFKANHNIKSGVPNRRVTEDDGLFTKEQKDFIKANVKGLLNQELADLLNKTFGLSITARQMNSYKKNHGLQSGLNFQFKKGQKAWNKGMKGLDLAGENGRKTQFKKGHRPQNYRPIGSERIDSKDGYTVIKVQDEGAWNERWRHKHVVLWEKENGPVPKGYVIIFADRDKRNFNMENLLLVSRAQLALMNKNDLFQNDADLTKLGIVMADIHLKIGDRKRKEGSRS